MMKLLPTLGGVVALVLLAADPVHAQTASGPHPGTEASLRRYIESLEKGKPNYEEMGPQLARVVREQLPQVLDVIYRVGALQDIAFQRVDPDNGMDVYRVSFEHGQIEWRIAPLAADGKVISRGFQELPQ